MRRSHVGMGLLLLILGIGFAARWILDEPVARGDRAPGLDVMGPAPSVESRGTAASVHGTPGGVLRPKPFVEDAAAQAGPADDAGALTGIVLDFDRTPASDVVVAIFAMDGDTPAEEALTSTRTGVDGAFRFSAPLQEGDRAIVAFRSERRPTTARLTIGGGPIPPVALTLGEGATISGTVKENENPSAHASLLADRSFGTPGHLVDTTELWWEAGAFEAKVASTVCDAGGRFVLRGLARATYAVTVQLGQAPGARALINEWSTDVVAPSTGVELGAATATIQFRVVDGGGALLRDSIASLEDALGTAIRGRLGEPWSVRVLARTEHTVQATCLGFEQAECVVPPLAGGETRAVNLELKRAPHAELRLRLRGAAALALKEVALRFFRADAADAAGSQLTQELRFRLRATAISDEEFVLPVVPYPPGQYLVAILPAATDSWLLPTQTTVELPRSGLVRATVDAMLGGRVDVQLAEGDRSPETAAWSLRDASGAMVASGTALSRAPLASIRFSVGSIVVGRGGLGASASEPTSTSDRVASARAAAAASTRGCGVIAPGIHQLVAIANDQTVTQWITVAAGQTTLAEISF